MAPLQSSSKRSANTLTNSLKMQTTAAGLISTLIDYEEGQQQQQDSISINNNESLMRTIASADSETAENDTHADDKKNDKGIDMPNSSSANGDIPSAASSGLDLQHLDEKTKKLIPKRASDCSSSEDDNNGEGISSLDNIDDSVDKVTVTTTKQPGEW